MRISKEELLKIIHEELNSLVSEEKRALNEGLMDVIKRGIDALAGGKSASIATSLVPVLGAMQKINAAARESFTGLAKTLDKIKEKSQKSVVLAVQKNFRTILQALVKKSITDAMKQSTAAGISEEEAQAIVAAIIGVELAYAISIVNLPPTSAKPSEPARGSMSTKPSAGSKPSTPTAATTKTV
jgi:hypothetical protein